MSKWNVDGFRFAGVHCGIKGNGQLDLGLIVADEAVPCAGVYTTNLVVAAPVILSRKHIAQTHHAQAVVINSGNANACTGAQGMTDAIEMAHIAAQVASCTPDKVQVCSTGVIGAPLPMTCVRTGLKAAAENLSSTHLPRFADAICTTDTFRKMRRTTITIEGREIQIAGVSKGAGMIHPNMATMLGVVLTNAPLANETLTSMWQEICGQTFNAISVDGDTSTNDTALMLASGRAGGENLTGDSLHAFRHKLLELTRELALDIVRDAEGGTKVVTVSVRGAKTSQSARTVAETIALSPLVKTALHGEDPNWGRIIAAAGRSGVQLNPNALTLTIGNTVIYRTGQWMGPQAERDAHTTMKQDSYELALDLNDGSASHSTYTCDLSEKYIRINADYRS